MKVGHFTVDPVIDGVGHFRPTMSFRGTTDEQWDAHRDLLDGDGMLGFSMGGFLIRGNGRTVLVDAGLGTGTLMGITGGAMLDNLRALGVKPGDVTDVVFTHLHLDHVGWASADRKPVFTNATYRCSAKDWDHFMVHNRGAECERIEPAAKQFETWDANATILPGVDTIAAPGHTPGSTVLVLSSGTERAMLLGDVVHCPVQLVDDEWAGLFDVDPVLARTTRNALAREIEGSDVPVGAAHFPGLRFGRLLPAEGRRRWVV